MVKKRFERKKLRFFLTITPLPPMSFHKKKSARSIKPCCRLCAKKNPSCRDCGICNACRNKKATEEIEEGLFYSGKMPGMELIRDLHISSLQPFI